MTDQLASNLFALILIVAYFVITGFCLVRLFRNQTDWVVRGVWTIVILFPVLGPIIFLLTMSSPKQQQAPRTNSNK